MLIIVESSPRTGDNVKTLGHAPLRKAKPQHESPVREPFQKTNNRGDLEGKKRRPFERNPMGKKVLKEQDLKTRIKNTKVRIIAGNN